MAVIICEDQQYELPDNSPLRPICEHDLDVAFGCNSGYCGICQIEIAEGHENMSELTEAEKDMGMDEHIRFACQCKIKGGTVKLRV